MVMRESKPSPGRQSPVSWGTVCGREGVADATHDARVPCRDRCRPKPRSATGASPISGGRSTTRRSRSVPISAFPQMGLDSATSAYFIVELEEWVGVELEPELVFDYPTDRRAGASHRRPAGGTTGDGARDRHPPRRAPAEFRLARRSAAPPRRGAAGRARLCGAVGPRPGSGAHHLRRAGRPRRGAGRADRGAGAPGERALLLCPNGIGFMVGFFGCLLAGVIAVPMMLPRRQSARDASASIVADCTPRLALAPAALIAGERGDPASGRFPAGTRMAGGRRCRPMPAGAPAGRSRRRGGDDIAFLQYTSGSTSAPKGVMVSHANLLANLAMIAAGLRQHAALDLCQLGAALPRHGADH